MSPLPSFLIIVSLPLLLGGCGEKHEGAKLRYEPELEGRWVDEHGELFIGREHTGIYTGIGDITGGTRYFLKGSDTPYTGTQITYKKGMIGRTKHQEKYYKDGKEHGLWTYWYKNGQKMSEGNWKDDSKVGLHVGWHENGQKSSEGNYKEGFPDGLWVFWHENGQKKQETNHKDGVEISEKFWNSKGEPVDSWEEARK